jgi:uroporphyrin-III C-methyltransferase
MAIVLGRFISGALNREYANEVAYEEHLLAVRASGEGSKAVPGEPEGEVTAAPREAKEGKCTSRADSPITAASALTGTSALKPRRSARISAIAVNGSKGRSQTPPPIGQSPLAQTSTAPSAEQDELYPAPRFGAGLPLTFQPHGQVCVVVGTNRLAATRALSMLEADAKVVIASETGVEDASFSDELRYRTTKGQMTFVQLQSGTDEAGWREWLLEQEATLVCVTDTLIGSSKRSDRSVDAIAEAARALRIPINISDHPASSTFSFPSTHRFTGIAGPSSLQVAVSTNAKGCRLATRIKRDIVTRLPSSIGAAVDNVGMLRDHAKSMQVSDDDVETPLNSPVPQLDTPSLLSKASDQLAEAGARIRDGLTHERSDTQGEESESQLRRMRWVHQMSEYYSYDALARITPDEMEGALSTWRGANGLPHHDGKSSVPTLASGSSKKGTIYLVGSGPGHPGLLTVAALHVFRTATVILSDKLVPDEILALIPKTTRVHIAKKFPGNNEGAQNEMMELSLAAARRGETVVRLKQGDPFVYGRGGEEVLYFRQNGFEAAVIPGVSSAMAGPAMLGIPVTQRGVAESMVLCTGVGRAGKKVQLPGYVRARTLALLMGVARIGSIVEVLTGKDEPGRDGPAYPPHLPIAIIERASSPDQRAIHSTLQHVEEALKSLEERPPGMMLIGWAALALEGKGRVDVLDHEEDEERERAYGQEWLGGKRWKVVEGLDEGWKRLEGIVDLN